MSNWEATQQILQGPNPIIKKPALTDKYLTKPPFRFLHDVITAVQNSTGFAKGLYNDAELDAKAIQDKESKVSYLSKIMDVVSIVLGEPVPAKPLKVVAGLEPEATNVFLQMLGKACKMDATKAVAKVLAKAGGGGAAAVTAAPEPSRPSSRPSSQHPKAEDEAADAKPSSKDKSRSSKDGEKAKSSSSSSKSKDKPAEEKKEERKEERKEKAPSAEKEKAPEKEKESKSKSSSSSKSKPKEDAPPPAAEPTNVRDPSPSTDAKFARPQSARKAPPKLPAAAAAAPPPAASRPAARKVPAGAAPPERPGTASGRPGAAPIQVYEENAKHDDDDDDVEVVTEQAPPAFSRSIVANGEQGVLVKNIIEAERSLKKAGEEAAAPAEEENGGTGIILGKRRGGGAEKAGGKADSAAVRELVQRLVQSSHPLAKSMDYLQEDLDNMAKEYRFWVTERRVYQDKLAEEQRYVSDTSRIASQLADQDSQIRQTKERILGLKAQVLRNEETIAKLLGMATGGR